MIFEKILISVLVLLFLIHLIPLSIDKKTKRAYPFLGLMSNFVFLGYFGKKFFSLGDNKYEIIKVWNYFSFSGHELNISYILDDISFIINLLIIFLNLIFYIFCILKWNYLKDHIKGVHFVIFYLGTIFSHLAATSESFFQILFLWPITSLILLFFTKRKETLRDEKVLDSFYIIEGISFFSLIISCIIIFDCFNGSLSFSSFKNLNFTFIKNNQLNLSLGIIGLILPNIFRVFFGQQNNISIIDKPSDWFKFGFLFDIISSSVLLYSMARIFPVLNYLPIVLKFFTAIGCFVIVYSVIVLFLDHSYQRKFLWFTNFIWGNAFLFLGFAKIGSAISLVISFLIIKNILLLINCESSFIKKRNENEKEFLLGISSLMVFSLCFLPGSSFFIIISELPNSFLISEGENVIAYFLFPVLLSILFLPSLKLTTKEDPKGGVLIFLKSIMNIPKNIIKLSLKDYFLYLLMIVIFFLYMATNFDFTRLFISTELNSINFVGDDLVTTSKNIYFVASFYILSLLILFLKFYLDKKGITFIKKNKIFPVETRKRLFSLLLMSDFLRRIFNGTLRTLNSFFLKLYNLILLKIVFHLPFKLAFQAGHFFNLKKGNGLVDSFVFAFLGSTIFLFYIFSKIK